MPTWSMQVNRWSGRSSGAFMGASSPTAYEASTGCDLSDTAVTQCDVDPPPAARRWWVVSRRPRFALQEAAMSGSVIVAGARTPIGRLLGGLKGLSAAELGGVAIKGALEKAGVSGDQVDYLIMGQVIQAGAGQNPARTAGVAAGLPMSLPPITIKKICPSGVNAIATADALINAGVHDIIVAGGMESMTNAPHLLPKSREGTKFGDATLVDSMAYDALYDQTTQQAMGRLTD